MFTKCLALDLAKFKIRVNAIGPGVIRTAMSEPRLRIPERLAYYESRVPLGLDLHFDRVLQLAEKPRCSI